MYDIKQLEQEWKQYRKKKLKPWYIGSLSFILLSVFVALFLMNDKIDFSTLRTYFEVSKETLAQEEKSNNKVKKIQNSVLVNDALNSLEIKENMIAFVKKPVNILVDIPVLEDTNGPHVEEVQESKVKMHLEIIESTSVTAYKDVEKRFLESHEIDDALFLARSYYKKGDYEKAAYWALEINKLDNDMEEGLLIFVKSKVKMGGKNEAISILTTYMKKSDSPIAKKLLYRIENDKL